MSDAEGTSGTYDRTPPVWNGPRALLTETCTRVLLLEPGKPCAVGSANEVAARYAEPTGG